MTQKPGRYEQAEWEMRIALAACYRLADRFGFSDIIWNHITARVPGTDHFLINRFGLRYDEITASNLITLDLDGNVLDEGSAKSDEAVNVTGFVIHSAIHAARPDIHCVMHSHTDAGLAVSALEEGLVPLVQDAYMFHNRVAYHEYEGMSMDVDERERLAASLGSDKVMFLRNHGLLTCGETVGEALILMYYLDRSCKVQMDVRASGRPVHTPTAEMCEHAAQQYSAYPLGKYEWDALVRLLDKETPDYRD
jgi:ribulose-5-phosphate 4-epimerase/fuculose-1-phosphate aldolase